MQRFFFHFVSPDETVRDERGVVLPDLAGAHAHAMRLVRELIPILSEQDRRKWRIDIGNDEQNHLITVLFPVFTTKQSAPARAAERADAPEPKHPPYRPGTSAAAFGRRR